MAKSGSKTLPPLTILPNLSRQSEKVSLNLASAESISTVSFVRCTLKIKPFPLLDNPMKVPFSDREESLLLLRSLGRMNICAGQPNTLNFLKSIFSPVLNCKGARYFKRDDGHRFFRKAAC